MTGAGNADGPPGVYPAMNARPAPTRPPVSGAPPEPTDPPGRAVPIGLWPPTPVPGEPSDPSDQPDATGPSDPSLPLGLRPPAPVRGGRPAGPPGPDRNDDPAPEALGPDEFSAFYRDTWPGVARALAVALGDRDLAVDATDEAMARAYPRWSRLRGYDNPGAWVYRVGLNWARSHRRRLARRPPVAHPPDLHQPPVGDPAVHAALLDLPVSLRSVVVCRLLLDWSVADTATALGVRPGTVQSRLHRALRSLHDTLDHLR